MNEPHYVQIPVNGSSIEIVFKDKELVGTLSMDGVECQVYLGNIKAERFRLLDGELRTKRVFTLVEV